MAADLQAADGAIKHPTMNPTPSLLATGAGTRVLGAMALLVLLWLAVAWALQGGA